MDLVKAEIEDIAKIFDLFESVKIIGKERGNSDWDENYPNYEIIKDDIENGNLYVLENEEKICGTITMIPIDELDISPLKWKEPYGCLLVRLCVSPEMQNKGIGEKIMKGITEYSKSLGIKATHHLASIANPAANRLYERMKYENRGKVYLFEHYYYAYEKIISNI